VFQTIKSFINHQDCSHCVSFSLFYSTNEQITNKEAFYYYYMYGALQIYLFTYLLLTSLLIYLFRKIRRIIMTKKIQNID